MIFVLLSLFYFLIQKMGPRIFSHCNRYGIIREDSLWRCGRGYSDTDFYVKNPLPPKWSKLGQILSKGGKYKKQSSMNKVWARLNCQMLFTFYSRDGAGQPGQAGCKNQKYENIKIRTGTSVKSMPKGEK